MIDWLTWIVVGVYYVVIVRPDAKQRARERKENQLRQD